MWSSSHTPRPISRVSLSGLGGERLGQVMTQAARLSLPHHHHDHVVKIICLALPSRQPPPLLPPPLPPPLLFASLSPSICPVSIICCSRFPWLSLLLPIVLLLLCVCYALTIIDSHPLRHLLRKIHHRFWDNTERRERAVAGTTSE